MYKDFFKFTSLVLSASICACVSLFAYAPEGYKKTTITLPKGIQFHVTGLDVGKDGTVYCATRIGEVWRLKGDDWLKIAESLHEPTGLLCEDDGSLVVAHKPELTRLVDTDGDEIIDEFVRISSGWEFHDNYHEFNFGPVKDKDGNYYGTLNLSHGAAGSLNLGGSAMGSSGGFRGWAYKVTPDGEFIPYASGLRSPAGIGISPDGDVFFTDNQGDWVGTSKLHLLEEGKFYGHPVSLRDKEGMTIKQLESMSVADFDEIREEPTLWIPHIEVANSPGNPAWDITEGKFGPFEGQMFIGDQTQSNIFRATVQMVEGKLQGMVINFMDGFQSGNIRTVFDGEGQLWVGQTARGWSAKGGKPFGLEKLNWDGTNPFEILNVSLTATGFKIDFTEELDAATIDQSSVAIENWYYLYHATYGSPKQELARLNLEGVKVSEDGMSLFVELPLTAERVYGIEIHGVKSISGRSVSVAKAYYTANRLIQ